MVERDKITTSRIIQPTSVIVGERNVCIFSCAAVKCRRIAGTFRKNRNDYSQRYQDFVATVLPGILELNSELTSPLEHKEVRASTASAVRYCLSDRYRPLGRTSEEATFINLNFRWKNHTSVKKKARAMGISRGLTIVGAIILMGRKWLLRFALQLLRNAGL